MTPNGKKGARRARLFVSKLANLGDPQLMQNQNS
jgi:hypothetical protein